MISALPLTSYVSLGAVCCELQLHRVWNLKLRWRGAVNHYHCDRCMRVLKGVIGLWNELEDQYWQVSIRVDWNKVLPSTVCCFLKLLPNQSLNFKGVRNDGCGGGDRGHVDCDDDDNENNPLPLY